MKVFFIVCLLLLSSLVRADFVEVILLGTGTPVPSDERFGPATLVKVGGLNLLFDSGRGATIRLQQAGLTADQVEHVFLTHLHSDHISGLDDVWITGWIWQRTNPLGVWGPEGTSALMSNLHEAYAADISYRSENAGLDKSKTHVKSTDISEGIIFTQNGVTVKAFLVDHAPVKPAFGYRIEFGERVVVISGDTTYSKNLVEHSQDVDLLIHEITAAPKKLLERNKRLQNVIAYHTTPNQLVDVLSATNPRMTILYHVLLFGITEEQVIKDIVDQYSGEVKMGADLMKISVGNSINIQ
jgi:ribonuclease Z